MRFRPPLGRSLFFVGAFVFSLLALFPLRLGAEWLGLSARGFAAREAEGSIWLGALTEAQFGSVQLGTLQAQLRTLPLLVGRARVDLRRDGEALEGAATLSRHGFGIDDLSGRIDAGLVFAPFPVRVLHFTDLTAHFADGQCARAEGGVKASLAGDAGGIELPSAFSGTARCQGGALLLPLTGPSGMERLDIFLFESGRWRMTFAIRSPSPALAARLRVAGLVPRGNAYILEARGGF